MLGLLLQQLPILHCFSGGAAGEKVIGRPIHLCTSRQDRDHRLLCVAWSSALASRHVLLNGCASFVVHAYRLARVRRLPACFRCAFIIKERLSLLMCVCMCVCVFVCLQKCGHSWKLAGQQLSLLTRPGPGKRHWSSACMLLVHECLAGALLVLREHPPRAPRVHVACFSWKMILPALQRAGLFVPQTCALPLPLVPYGIWKGVEVPALCPLAPALRQPSVAQ